MIVALSLCIFITHHMSPYTQTSLPPALNPYQASSSPSSVQLRVTAASLLTVSFAPPLDNGGDPPNAYLVEWDMDPNFNSQSPKPNKGTQVLDASQRSYTIQGLSSVNWYYVRVSARNSFGVSQSSATSPAYAQPAAQVPGKPQSVLATSGTRPGSIRVTWREPTVPWHGIPCGGSATNPTTCPLLQGSSPTATATAANGGSNITQYIVTYSEREDFTGTDQGQLSVSNNAALSIAGQASLTLTGLTPGRMYYIRVQALNAIGAGLPCSFAEPNCLIVNTKVTAIATAG